MEEIVFAYQKGKKYWPPENEYVALKGSSTSALAKEFLVSKNFVLCNGKIHNLEHTKKKKKKRKP